MIISFATHKGGVGKTTSSINVAAALALERKKTLLIDIDPQGHSTRGLGIDLDYEADNIADALKPRGVGIENTVVTTSNIENLDVVPSNIRLAVTAEELYSKIRKKEMLQRALVPIKDNYQYIIIDCPPNIGVLTWNAVLVSDLVIIPCQMAARSADGLADLLDVIEEVKGADFQDYRILLTSFDTRTTITNEAILLQLENYKDKILKTVIPKNEALNQAQIIGKSIFEFDPKSKGAHQYIELTKEILRYGQERTA